MCALLFTPYFGLNIKSSAMSWILSALFVLLTINHQVCASGVFELRLLSFENWANKDENGNCCAGEPFDAADPSSACAQPCEPRFRVCLKEYQTHIDTKSPCTFGDVITATKEDGFSHPIRFPFPFTWPNTFSLIVEAWHGNLTSSEVLIARMTRSSSLAIGNNWTPYEQRAEYATLRFEYRATCDDHYYGKGCENLCRPRDDNFGHSTCSPSGELVCLDGWEGGYCTKPICRDGCHPVHGQCNRPYECTCKPGWEGEHCDQCQLYPGCVHGTCEEPWKCMCEEGWGGLFCNQDLNFCTNHKPCRNGGTCFNTGQGSYTCQCPDGFTGTECEILVNDCFKTPCENGGTCMRSANSSYHTCVCPVGYHGFLCEDSSQTCRDNPCKNGAKCTDTNQGYQCTCKPGYSGSDCEHQVNDCNPNPCKNGGNCVDGINEYSCKCPLGFAGVQCEINIDDCKGNPCKNGGSCMDEVNGFRCVCVPGFVGQLCSDRVDYCVTKPCANGGTCERLTNDFRCKCAAGFGGKDCSIEIDECESQPCQNGGTCLNRLHGFECQCPLGFNGRSCEEVATSAAPSARVSSESTLSTEHVVVIATVSTFVPLLAIIAVGVLVCMKQRRKREKAKADEEARLQNEQNTAHSSFTKRGTAIAPDAHMIKNSWGKCTNVLSVPDECNMSATSDDAFPKSSLHIDGRSVYTLQRSRSQKQLNTELGPRALAAKLHEPDFEPVKRLSVMSNTSAVCGANSCSDPSLLKRPLEKDVNGGVYVIGEHFHHSPNVLTDGLYATEV